MVLLLFLKIDFVSYFIQSVKQTFVKLNIIYYSFELA